MTQYHFLPETSQAFKDELINVIGSCQLEQLAPTAETVTDLQLVHLGQKTYDQVVLSVIERAKNAA